MRRNIFTWVFMCMAALALFATSALAAKVIVISGVSEESAARIGYTMVYDGIREGFKTAGITPVFQWVELDTLGSDEAKSSAGAAALAKARQLNPDLIITLNDDCVRYVGLKVDDIPVVFAWVFGRPETLGLPKANITGVVRRSYAPDIFGLSAKLFQSKSVVLLSKESVSMGGVKKYMAAGADKLQAATGVRFMDMYLLNTFEEWENSVKTCPADFIYLTDTSRIVKDGKELSGAELTRWTVDNAKVPVIAALERDVQAGALFSIITSEKAIGLSAAEIALKILGGATPADIPYVASTKGKLVVNAKTAQKYNLDIPFEILASAEKVYE